MGPWMTGQAGLQVRVRFMPHRDHRIEVYDATTGRYLGPADLADQAIAEQVSAVRRARAARARHLKKDLEASQRERYAATSQAGPPQRLGVLTGAQADAELAQATDTHVSDLALPDVVPPAAPPADWHTPASLAARTRPAWTGAAPPAPHDTPADGPPAPSAAAPPHSARRVAGPPDKADTAAAHVPAGHTTHPPTEEDGVVS
ncbi:Mu transposase C-terminal domain-containing protein [Streptomyces sp. NPDC014861]|uniref:Mu transposase C-terminal domain-containing protein n=1 Tax=Streptomyces sp. NPDC014861 TaxID=3364923 RepID=UPI0036FBEF5E